MRFRTEMQIAGPNGPVWQTTRFVEYGSTMRAGLVFYADREGRRDLETPDVIWNEHDFHTKVVNWLENCDERLVPGWPPEDDDGGDEGD
jgi:hypothetical protein